MKEQDITDELISREETSGYSFDKENSIKEDIKILGGIIKGDEDCINAIYSQMKVKNANDEDIQYYKKEIQSIKNIVDNYLKEKARADKLEKEYSAMLTKLDENECDYKRVLKENEELLEVKVSASACNRILELEKENEELKKYKEYYSSTRQLVDNNYIHKQKIKDIIDRIDYDIKKTKEIISNGQKNDYQIVRLRAMNTKSLDIKKRLQKLLESEK